MSTSVDSPVRASATTLCAYTSPCATPAAWQAASAPATSLAQRRAKAALQRCARGERHRVQHWIVNYIRPPPPPPPRAACGAIVGSGV